MKKAQEYIDMRKARGKALGIISNNPKKNKSNYNYSHSNKNNGNPSNRDHVVVKATKGDNSKSLLLYHFDYDSRENTLPIYDKNGEVIDLNDAKEQALSEYEITKVKANKKEEPMRTYRLVFSMNGKNDEEKMKKAVKETIQAQIKDNTFFYSLHPDTDNTHVHVTIMKRSLSGGKNLHLDKKLLNRIKEQYSINLEKQGIIARFKSETDKQTEAQKEISKSARDKRRENANVYRIDDHGKANYQFKKDAPESYYLFLKTKNGKEKSMWNKGLELAIKQSGVKIGDYIKIKEIKDANGKSFSTKQWAIENVTASQKIEPMTIQNMGEANYQFRKNGKPSSYIEVKDNNGNTSIIWDKLLAQKLKEIDVTKGDRLTINNAGNVLINRQEEQTINKTKSKDDKIEM